MATIGEPEELRQEYHWRYLKNRWKQEPYYMLEDMLRVPTATGEWVDYKIPECHIPILKAGLLYNPMPTVCLRWINKFRQGGFSYLFGAETIGLSHVYSGAQTLYVATNEDLAEQWLSKMEGMINHCKQFPNRRKFVVLDKRKCTKLVKVLKNSGFVVRGIASTAPAIRSPTALNINIDEMAWQIQTKDQQKNIIAAIRPTISQGGCMTVFSTPRDTKDEYWKIKMEAKENGFKCFTIPVFNNKPEKIDLTKSFFDQPHLKIQVPWIPMQVLEKERLADIDTFRQERLNVPLDEIQLFITEENLRECVKEVLVQFEHLETNNPVFMGIDCAMKKDKTAITIVEKVGATFLERNITELDGNTEIQANEIIQLINRFHPMKVSIDVTGMGIGIYDKLYNNFGALIHSVNFSNSEIINRLASNFKTQLLQKRYYLLNNKEAINQVLRVRKIVTPTRIKYSGKDTGRDDHFFSKILACPVEETQYGHVSSVMTSSSKTQAIKDMESTLHMSSVKPGTKIRKGIYI